MHNHHPQPDINQLRLAFAKGENIVQLLYAANPGLERSEVIEIAYDIQSGSYTNYALEDPDRFASYASGLYDLCSGYLEGGDVILDCGTGELTTLSALSLHLPADCELLACDISLSRLRVGRRFADRFMRTDLRSALSLFVADMAHMPLADSSVDVVLTVHALEPNHGREKELLEELLRVVRRRLILFEPSWENGSQEVRSRMDRHGYVRDLPRHIAAAGGRLVSVKPLPEPLDSLNPTYCYVIEPIAESSRQPGLKPSFCCPRSGFPLQKFDSYWWSADGAWAYPDIDGIPCLRIKHGVLMSHA